MTRQHLKTLLAAAVGGAVLSFQTLASSPATNLIPNPGAEAVMPSASFPKELEVSRTKIADEYPDSWAAYNGSGFCRWGSSKEAHSGERSAFLTMTPIASSTASLGFGICFGGGNGYSGAKAIPVQGNHAYYFAFYAKGDITNVNVRFVGWKEGNLSHNGRRFLPTTLEGIALTEEWRLFECYIVTPGDIARVTPMVFISLPPEMNQAEGTVYIDDVVMTPYVPARLDQVRDAPIRVGVYEDQAGQDRLSSKGRMQIVQALQTASGIAPRIVDNLRHETLAECDVIIISNILDLSPADKASSADWELALLNFLDSGKGVILGHDGIGLRGVFGENGLFSMVCSGKRLVFRAQDLIVADAAHPVTRDLPQSFRHAHNDHVSMIAAPDAVVHARNQDDEPVIVSGSISRGRVVAVGFPMGISARPSATAGDGKGSDAIISAEPPTADEARLLINSVRWCAEPPRFAIPALLTKATLAEELRVYNNNLKEAAARHLIEFKPDPEYKLTVPRPGNEPIGGGRGYSKIPDMAQADFKPETSAELLTALVSAQPGALIYIPDTAEIDLSGLNEITIPGGVTLASGRGRILEDGSVSEGALLRTSTHGALFVVSEPGVRLTGFRLGGPAPERFAPIPTSVGVIAVCPVEIDNCRLWGWVSAIDVRGKDSHIHNNVIHHSGYAGLSYGVIIHHNGGGALIEENIFDYMRHAVAGGGTFSYEARYNITGKNMYSGSYDAHGANDAEKTYMLANWRFDIFKDNTIFNGIEGRVMQGRSACTLTLVGACLEPNMYRNGIFDLALRLSGDGDFAVCDQPPAIFQHVIGAVEFRIKADPGQRQRPIMCKYQDNDNFWLLQLNSRGCLQLIIKVKGRERVNLTSAKILTPRWHHVIVQQHGGVITMTIDAVQTALSGQGLKSRDWTRDLKIEKIWIGRDATNFFAGALDEIRIYLRALDNEQVRNHYRYPDVSGSKIEIHHNTLYSDRDSTLCLRGIPQEVIRVYSNHFVAKSDPGQAVWQYSTGSPIKYWSYMEDGQWHGVGIEVFDNIFGPMVEKE
jgi:hypothetical protein